MKALRADADQGVEDGVYACGVDQFEDGKFGDARTTLTDFARTYKGDGRVGKARNIAIAAEIADDRPHGGQAAAAVEAARRVPDGAGHQQ